VQRQNRDAIDVVTPLFYAAWDSVAGCSSWCHEWLAGEVGTGAVAAFYTAENYKLSQLTLWQIAVTLEEV